MAQELTSVWTSSVSALVCEILAHIEAKFYTCSGKAGEETTTVLSIYQVRHKLSITSLDLEA